MYTDVIQQLNDGAVVEELNERLTAVVAARPEPLRRAMFDAAREDIEAAIGISAYTGTVG